MMEGKIETVEEAHSILEEKLRKKTKKGTASQRESIVPPPKKNKTSGKHP